MAQGKGSATASGATRDTGQEEHRGDPAESYTDILCTGYDIKYQSHANGCQEPNELVPKLFGPIRERYANRPGGYTRVLRIEPMKEDQAESAILELVDGPKDLKFAMTAKTLAQHPQNRQLDRMTALNVKKTTQFRKDGVEGLREMVSQMRVAKEKGIDDRVLPPPRKVYPEEKMKREMHYYQDVDFYKLPNKLVKIPKKSKKEESTALMADSEVAQTQVEARSS
jgi:large subunit ribosomal protein L17